MSVVFATAVSHTPGIRAWADAPPADQRERFFGHYEELGEQLRSTNPDAILIITSEHFANFFLDTMPAFTIGQGESHFGPVEPWLKVQQGMTPGAPELAARLLDACYEEGFELTYSHELKLDHGTIVPLSFFDPERKIPVIPLIINCMTFPLPSPARCYSLGQTLGATLESDDSRVAVVATVGLGHAPGERIHGEIDTEFDHKFLRKLTEHDAEGIAAYSDDELTARGLGTHELRTWMTLAGLCGERQAEVLFYEPVKAWATGCCLLSYR
jgi:aromatic ring-opening dioxygenase catalytic subunit (LigB family)